MFLKRWQISLHQLSLGTLGLEFRVCHCHGSAQRGGLFSVYQKGRNNRTGAVFHCEWSTQNAACYHEHAQEIRIIARLTTHWWSPGFFFRNWQCQMRFGKLCFWLHAVKNLLFRNIQNESLTGDNPHITVRCVILPVICRVKVQLFQDCVLQQFNIPYGFTVPLPWPLNSALFVFSWGGVDFFFFFFFFLFLWWEGGARVCLLKKVYNKKKNRAPFSIYVR